MADESILEKKPKRVTITRRQQVPVCMDWESLNSALKKIKDEAVALEMLLLEKNGSNRATWKLRIHARYNLLRGRRERSEL